MAIYKKLFLFIFFLQCLAWGYAKVRYPYYLSLPSASNSNRPRAEEMNAVFCKIDFIMELLSRHPEKISSLTNKDLDEIELMLSLMEFEDKSIDETSVTVHFRDFLRSKMNSQDYLASFLSGMVHKYIEDEDGKLVIYPKQFASFGRWRSSSGGSSYDYFHYAKIFKININIENSPAEQGLLSVSFIVPNFGGNRDYGYLQLLTSMREGYYFSDEKKIPHAPLRDWRLLSTYFITPYAVSPTKIVIKLPFPKSIPSFGEFTL